MPMFLLPPPQDACQICATEHEKHYPHNKESLYYQMVFFNQHGRYPTWDDAMLHCSKEMRKAWREELSYHDEYILDAASICDDEDGE